MADVLNRAASKQALEDRLSASVSNSEQSGNSLNCVFGPFHLDGKADLGCISPHKS